MTTDYLERILKARVYDVAIETPLDLAANLSKRLGNRVYFKREDLQPVFSFKLRGAYNKMAQLSPELLAKGVIAASAGNHAQGVALGASKLGTRAIIVMPETTPQVKVEAVKARGGVVVLYGETYDDAYGHARQLEQEKGLTFIHPFNDPDVIAGQGTIGMEILRQYQQPIDAIFVAIGGGGLIAGVAAYVKRLYPEIKIIGVEPTDADAMRQSLAAGKRVKLNQVGLFADGVAVREVGDLTFPLCQQYVDDILLVDTDDTCAAIKDCFEDTRSILEPAGALAIAGLKQYVQKQGCRDQTLVAIACGANMNFDRLRFVAERAEYGEQREAIFAVTIPEQRGSLRKFCEGLGKHNITEFSYRIAEGPDAHIFVGIQVQNRSDASQLAASFNRQGFKTLDLTDDELTKLHLRHMVGGRPPQVTQLENQRELLYRFEFPERPGALMKFLGCMDPAWNISLFHYRNHGADYGRIVVGMQVPLAEMEQWQQFLANLGYRYWDESDNPVYRLFLR
ncbi:L-threonine deaminase [Synechocystis sp. PCC 6803]|uniref:L-threonine dehydratase n=1 Tax=Synechocystis sp. (strain ATCC 27184 / PCC 6803 / Kazusa) TaxID=1111708 RepID=P73375_SYNY3|nr:MULTISPECIES: threonine ammonia-lyase, biosynthetic [unclassified Synechocystis]BAM51132.1 threonine dehydratase [Synechocystis sp. PCC 6803] [Bacillus subtilis BEST7613]AGF51095.1 L-threonine deaminase [Synechocystis sp. PCC 6803]ALJ67126.1 threonine dehydratase [Synechocystis sp. PCC 6803]AVP88967.1 threonine ammonia-lyase, biosynthetic [Synechocystis sp. IPPAS B-1465]MBD2618634.1 threonine ammonia-lyase, biosynthetic [Synechocystis sp. FACHB-898]